MDITIGWLILLLAGFFQGSFILPMTTTRQWNWENTWLSFSLFGMVLLNLLLAFFFIPGLFSVYRAVPAGDLALLMLFGLCWGLGAVLFGIAMERLGMALGYPVIMGLIASFGAVIPLFVFHSGEVLTRKGIFILAGAVIVVYGIILCARAHVLKTVPATTERHKSDRSAILIAVAAGILSCLPNIGYSLGGTLINEALNAGASSFMAGNSVWALFFTMGAVPNVIYTLYLLNRNKSFPLFRKYAVRNGLAGLAMAFMWIGSFYLYGISTIRLGSWGSIIAWPLFIAISIITGNLWGILRSEWKDASLPARVKLRQGLTVIFVAIVVIAVCNFI